MISFLLCTIRRAEENQSKNAIKHSPTRRSYHNTPIRSSSAAPLPGLLVLLQILHATPDQWFRRWCIDARWFRRSSSDYPVCMDDKCRRRRWIVQASSSSRLQHDFRRYVPRSNNKPVSISRLNSLFLLLTPWHVRPTSAGLNWSGIAGWPTTGIHARNRISTCSVGSSKKNTNMDVQWRV